MSTRPYVILQTSSFCWRLLNGAGRACLRQSPSAFTFKMNGQIVWTWWGMCLTCRTSLVGGGSDLVATGSCRVRAAPGSLCPLRGACPALQTSLLCLPLTSTLQVSTSGSAPLGAAGCVGAGGILEDGCPSHCRAAVWCLRCAVWQPGHVLCSMIGGARGEDVIFGFHV